MREELCRAFCDDLLVKPVKAGLAVSTRMWTVDGDPILFYIIGPDANGLWKVQDDGTTVPYLEAMGADLEVPGRASAFSDLLSEHGATYNLFTSELSTEPTTRVRLPASALLFVSLLLRVQDLTLFNREKSDSSWVEEVESKVFKALSGLSTISRSVPVLSSLRDYPADLVFERAGRLPVGLFFGTSDIKAYEALLLKAQVNGLLRDDLPVILMLESDRSIGRRQRSRADANLIVPRYRDNEADAIGRVTQTVLGYRSQPEAVH